MTDDTRLGTMVLMSRVEIADWVREHRERAGMSVTEFARALDVTNAAVYAWQNPDDPARPGEQRVPKLAEILGVTETEVRRALGYWVDEDDTPKGEDLDEFVDSITAVVRQVEQLTEEDLQAVWERQPADAQRGLENLALGVLRLASQRRAG